MGCQTMPYGSKATRTEDVRRSFQIRLNCLTPMATLPRSQRLSTSETGRRRCLLAVFNDTYSPWTHGPQQIYVAFMPSQGDILERFGRRVRQLRTAAGYSQEAFAAECGLDRTYFGGVERGERNLALRNIHRIAKALRLSLSELMLGL